MNDVTVLPNTMIENSKICSSVVVGPFSHIHSGTVIGEKSCVGNFVEIKNTHTKHGLKAKHLSYIGDSTIGNNCNIGSGVVTCNYNGDQTEKLTTNLSDNVFVGANSELIAPLSISKNTTIGAGSTITKDVPKNTLSVSRSKQKFFKKKK